MLGLLDRIEVGDVLIVTSVDRPGRNALDVRTTAARAHCLGLGGVDLNSPERDYDAAGVVCRLCLVNEITACCSGHEPLCWGYQRAVLPQPLHLLFNSGIRENYSN